MPRNVVDAELLVYDPTNTSTAVGDADTTVPGSDIESLRVGERIQDLLDEGSVLLHDNDGTYEGAVNPGSRIAFRVQLDGEGSLSRAWTGMVRPYTYEETGPATAALELDVDDFVFSVMDMRYVVNAFEDTAISGSASAILESILTNEASEIDQSQITTISDTATFSWEGKKLLDAVRELADEADAVVAQSDTSIVFKPLASVGIEWTLADTDRGLLKVRVNDDKLKNDWRIEGGQGITQDDTQTTQSSTTTVTDSSRITHQLSTTKSNIPRIEVYTALNGASTDNVVVRLQADSGGSPIDVGNRNADVARRTLASEFLADGGYTTFLMRPRDHRLYDPNPWLIIESDGSTGQDVGVDGSSNPTYKQYYRYPIATVINDAGSKTSYRVREGIHRDDTLETKAHTEQRGEALLRHSSEPRRFATFEAVSDRAHDLAIGEAIRLNEQGFNSDGILVDRQLEYDAGRNELLTELTVQDVTTI